MCIDCRYYQGICTNPNGCAEKKNLEQIRVDTIDEVKRYTDRNIYFLNANEQIEFIKFLEQLKEQK